MSMKDRIAEAIDSTGLTDSAFAKRMGKSKGVVTQWRDGSIRSLKAETAQSMQDITGYRSEWLISGKGPKNVEDGRTIDAESRWVEERPMLQRTEPENTVSGVLSNLGELLMQTTPKTRAAVADLLSRYAQDPATGQSLAQAIEVLIKADPPDNP